MERLDQNLQETEPKYTLSWLGINSTIILVGAFMLALIATGICSVITVLYICCFVLLSLETYALLLGSVLIFVLLAVIMYGSLRLPALKDC